MGKFIITLLGLTLVLIAWTISQGTERTIQTVPLELDVNIFCASRGGIIYVGPGSYSRPVFCGNGEHTHKLPEYKEISNGNS